MVHGRATRCMLFISSPSEYFQFAADRACLLSCDLQTLWFPFKYMMAKAIQVVHYNHGSQADIQASNAHEKES